MLLCNRTSPFPSLPHLQPGLLLEQAQHWLEILMSFTLITFQASQGSLPFPSPSLVNISIEQSQLLGEAGIYPPLLLHAAHQMLLRQRMVLAPRALHCQGHVGDFNLTLKRFPLGIWLLKGRGFLFSPPAFQINKPPTKQSVMLLPVLPRNSFSIPPGTGDLSPQLSAHHCDRGRSNNFLLCSPG